MLQLFGNGSAAVTWWGTEVECASAIARLERNGVLTLTDASEAFHRLMLLRRGWHEVEPLETVRATAQRLLRVHDLRAADSVQLAAAMIAAELRPASLTFVCLDQRLGDAAQREGFPVIDQSKL